jgi:oligopeptide transport system substrate-binding protein
MRSVFCMFKKFNQLCLRDFRQIIILFLCAGCSVHHPRAQKTQKDSNQLKLCLSSQVRSLDPNLGIDGSSTLIIKMLFEGLTYRDENGNIVPGAAQGYTISEDKKTYTFYLRSCNWTNGMPVTAYDFEYAWKKVIDHNQKFRSTAIHNFYLIKNVTQYLKGKCTLEDVGICALDEKTFQVILNHPVPYFLEAVSTSSFFPICKYVDEHNPNWAMQDGAHFVSNGPFILKKHKYDDKICLKKNPLFWDAKNVCLDGIKVYVIGDPMTRLSLFEKGEIDWVGKPFGRLPLEACVQLKNEKKLTILPALGIYWYIFNTEKIPFNNKKMRQAFAYALNRKEITEYILQEGERPAMGIFPYEYGFQTNPYFEDHDVAKARELFDQALSELHLKREDLPSLTISYNLDAIHAKVAEVVCQQLYDSLGLKIKLKPAEFGVHFNGLVEGDFWLGGCGWHSWLRDPIYTLQAFVNKKDGINMSRWENQQYQRLIAMSEEETNAKARVELLHEAEKLLIDELPVIPLYFNSISFAKSKRLKGEIISELYLVDFRHAYFDEEER